MQITTRIALLFALMSSSLAFAQGPEITSWMLNTTGIKGYNNIPANVQQVQYSATQVYVTVTGVPAFNIGPWPGNPNDVTNQNATYKFTRSPQQNTGTAVANPLGHAGIFINGVALYNARDAFSYQGGGIWNQNAVYVEAGSFDACLGHPPRNGEYHHHQNPTCLYTTTDTTVHAPLVGYAFDGFPIYGAYAYANTDGTGGVRRIRSSYRLRNITDRTTLADGTVLSASQYGPAINATYVKGYYLEDFEYVAGLGDLDEHNGRFAITPEYPQGTYAYYTTIDAAGNSAYPYVVGPTYYGTVQAGNIGPNSGQNTPTEPVTTFTPSTSAVANVAAAWNLSVYPNPAVGFVNVTSNWPATQAATAELVNALGQTVRHFAQQAPATDWHLDLTDLPAGLYALRLTADGQTAVRTVVVR